MALAAITQNSANPYCASEIAYLGVFELQLEFVRNQSDELTIEFLEMLRSPVKMPVVAVSKNQLIALFMA